MSRTHFWAVAALGAAWSAAHVPSARAAIITFTDRAAFNANTSGTSTITFQGLAPVNSFTFFNSPPGLTASGVNFQATAGSNSLFVIDPGFDPLFNFPSGQFLQNNSFVANSGINVTLPAGVTAFGTDVSAQLPMTGVFTFTLSTGEVFNFTLPGRPTLSFVGFTSDVAIASVAIRSSTGALTLDNVTFGQAAAVPEPASLALAGVGGLALVAARRLRRRPGA
ncbi:MAG: hypothetical protein C0501_25355 [Isosphaera sp.]|nr:hypothetical protein [Isosphaera sp.]